jgi:hypothetical protein
MQYTETEGGNTQEIQVTFQKQMLVKEIRIKNPDEVDDNIAVQQKGVDVPVTVTKSGTGLDAISILTFEQAIDLSDATLSIGVNGPAPGTKHTINPRTRGSALKSNYLNNKHVINYTLDRPGNVTLDIYSVNGSLISSTNLGHKKKGSYSYIQSALASGIYFIRLRSNMRAVASASLIVTR